MVRISRSDCDDRLSWLVPRGEVKRRSDHRTYCRRGVGWTNGEHKYPLLLSLSCSRRKGPVGAATALTLRRARPITSERDLDLELLSYEAAGAQNLGTK
jgi:hypothetical protein